MRTARLLLLSISAIVFCSSTMAQNSLTISPSSGTLTGNQPITITYNLTTTVNGSKTWVVTGTCNNCQVPPLGWTCNIPTTTAVPNGNCGIQFTPNNSGGSVTIGGSASITSPSTTITATDVVYTLALPIQLISFTAKNVETFTALEWSTATELNNEVFVIEKSVDGKNYEGIGKVNGAGNSNTTINYFFVDENKSKGVAYYRLKQVDFDGTFEYSDIVSVFNDPKDPNVVVYPNPSLDFAYVSLGDNKENLKSINIVNSLGSLVKTFNYNVNDLDESIRLDLSDLQKGTYYLQVVYKNTTTTELISKL